MTNLIDANTEHQILLTRVGTREARKFTPFLLEARNYIRAKLLDTENIRSQKELRQLNAEINEQLRAIYSEYTEVLQDDYPEISQLEIDFQERTISRASTGLEVVIPDIEQAIAAARLTPMAIGQKGSAVYLDDWLKAFPRDEAKRAVNRITMGFYTGETTAEIARAISGTRNSPGILNITRANGWTMAKTGVTQMSQTAKESFNKQNSDLIVGYTIVATLDSRTSDICKSYDGQEVLYTDSRQPMPPFHPNCRTSTAPLVNQKYRIENEGERPSVGAKGAQEVPATETYYTWLKKQPTEYQNEALGKERALIFRNSGLSPDEFRRATVDRFNQPLTIEQMAAKDERISSYVNE